MVLIIKSNCLDKKKKKEKKLEIEVKNYGIIDRITNVHVRYERHKRWRWYKRRSVPNRKAFPRQPEISTLLSAKSVQLVRAQAFEQAASFGGHSARDALQLSVVFEEHSCERHELSKWLSGG